MTEAHPVSEAVSRPVSTLARHPEGGPNRPTYPLYPSNGGSDAAQGEAQAEPLWQASTVQAAEDRRPLTARRVTFRVRGLPQAQGSARAFVVNGRAIVATEANRTRSPLGAWRSSIATEAREAMGDAALLEGAVSIDVEFVMPRPRAHFGTRGLRATAPVWHAQRPDIDKLLRALLDALTGVTFRDDSQVVELVVRKRFEVDDHRPGCIVSVEALR